MRGIHGSRAMYRPKGETFFRKLREILGFHVTLTVQQPKGRCVWGLRPRSRSLGGCFAENHAENLLKVPPPDLLPRFVGKFRPIFGGAGVVDWTFLIQPSQQTMALGTPI